MLRPTVHACKMNMVQYYIIYTKNRNLLDRHLEFKSNRKLEKTRHIDKQVIV